MSHSIIVHVIFLVLIQTTSYSQTKDVWELDNLFDGQFGPYASGHRDTKFDFILCDQKEFRVDVIEHIDMNGPDLVSPKRFDVSATLYASRSKKGVRLRVVIHPFTLQLTLKHSWAKELITEPPFTAPASEGVFDMELRDGATRDCFEGRPVPPGQHLPPGIKCVYTLRLLTKSEPDEPGHAHPTINSSQQKVLDDSYEMARSWLSRAEDAMEGFMKDPGSASSIRVSMMLEKHFAWDENPASLPRLSSMIIKQIEALKAALSQRLNAGWSPRPRFNVDPNCILRRVHAAATHGCLTCMTLYPDFFDIETEIARATTVIHETLHNLNDDFADHYQETDLGYPGRKMEEAYDNPASYAAFIRDLGK